MFILLLKCCSFKVLQINSYKTVFWTALWGERLPNELLPSKSHWVQSIQNAKTSTRNIPKHTVSPGTLISTLNSQIKLPCLDNSCIVLWIDILIRFLSNPMEVKLLCKQEWAKFAILRCAKLLQSTGRAGMNTPAVLYGLYWVCLSHKIL